MTQINEIFNLIKDHKWDKFMKILDDPTIDVNIKDQNGIYLISYVIMYNQIDILKKLIQLNVRLDIFDMDGNTLLLVPIKFGYDQLLDILLEYNSTIIGIPLHQIRDKQGKIALHYAIIYKNIYAIKKLLLISNVNAQDNNKYNSLHLAIYSKSIEIFNMILPHISNINATCATGETYLHIVCNLQLHNMIQPLIDNKINIDIQENEHEFSALHYSCSLGDIITTKILINNGANINIQDFYGNTPLHYCVVNDKIELTQFMMKQQKSVINVNLYNISLLLPFHIVLANNYKNFNMYVDLFIQETNINFQNSDGLTCLHYLCQNELWKSYKNILATKKMDIFIKDKTNKRPIDYINKKDLNDFIDLVATSYMHILKHKKDTFIEEWENICTCEPSNDEIKILHKYIKSKSSNDTRICINIIKQKLEKMMSQSDLTCYQKSYPVKQSHKKCIHIPIGESVSFCTFTGSPLDIIIGLLFLLQKHNDTCSTMNVIKENEYVCKFFDKLNVVIDQNCKLMNYIIIWAFNMMYFSDSLDKYIKGCQLDKSKKYIIIPVGIVLQNGSHSNYLLYDKITNEIERFEPYGFGYPPGLNYEPKQMDSILEKKFTSIIPNVKYVKPIDYLPKIGIQSIDITEEKNKYIGDPNGFCALWSIWYVDMRISNDYLKRDKLIKYMLRSLSEQHISFKMLIRNYAKQITDMRDNILEKVHININEWITGQYDEKIFNDIIKYINELFITLSQPIHS